MIRLDHVSFAYEGAEDRPVLQDVTLSVPAGQLVVVAGSSGCGKTTLTRLLNGLIPDCLHGTLTGTVRVGDRDPVQEKPLGMSRLVGSVFQNPKSQFFNINSRNELAFPLENRAVPREEILRRMEDTARKLHMEALVGRNLFHLSGGEKQKIAFASVFMADARVLVLDEPSSNLDLEAVRDLRTVLKLWKQAGKTIVISEHRLFYLRELADRLIVLDRGRIRKDLDRGQLSAMTEPELHSLGLRCFALPRPDPSRGPLRKADGFLQLRSLDFTYPASQRGIRLKELSFSRGRVVAVIGHNGAGKTTFLRCLAGLERRAKGELLLEGRPVRLPRMPEHCAMVLQDVNHQLFSDQVEAELRWELKRRKVPRADQEPRITEALQRLGLEQLRSSHPMSLSGGQKQRLALGTAALSGQDLILLDEPTSGLDYGHMQQVSGLIRGLRDAGKLIFLVSHDPELVLNLCDQVLVLEDGREEAFYDLTAASLPRLQAWFADLCGPEMTE